MDTSMRNAERVALADLADDAALMALWSMRLRAGLCKTCGQVAVEAPVPPLAAICEQCTKAGQHMSEQGGSANPALWVRLGWRSPALALDPTPAPTPPRTRRPRYPRERFDGLGRLGA